MVYIRIYIYISHGERKERSRGLIESRARRKAMRCGVRGKIISCAAEVRGRECFVGNLWGPRCRQCRVISVIIFRIDFDDAVGLDKTF